MKLDTQHRAVETFVEPATIDEAVAIKARLGDDALFVAGATDVGVLLRRHKAHPAHLVSLRRIPELMRFEAHDDGIFIGAGVAHRAVERSSWFPAAYIGLREACETVGSVQTRNVGTLGGNAANASPAADTPPVLMALGASIQLRGPGGPRLLPLEDFFLDYRRTALRPDELVEGFVLPVPDDQTGSAFTKLGRRGAMEISLACVGALVRLDPAGRCTTVGVGLGAVAPTVVRARAAEDVLRGREPTGEVLAEAGRAAVAAANPIDDVRGTADYRRDVLAVLVRRTLERAVDRARDSHGGRS